MDHPQTLCGIGRTIAAMAPEDADEIRANLAEESGLTTQSIAIAHGWAETTTRRHRAGICACSRADEAPGANLQQLINAVAQELDRQGVTEDTLGQVESIKLTQGTYQMLYKDADNVGHVEDLYKASTALVLHPSWDTGPRWETVQQVTPPKITHRKSPKRERDLKVAIIFPDPQVGFRRDMHSDDLTLDPFHDDRALDVAVQIAHHVRPDGIVNLGDGLDFPQFSRFPQEPTFAFTVQQALDRYHRFLADQRAALGQKGSLVVLEGNHDRRLENAIKLNCASAYGIKVANVPESWPVMSLPNLLRFDELGVNYIGGYPAGIFWINNALACVHGFKVKSGSTAAGYDERHSVAFGHIHRREMHTRRKRDRFGSYTTTNFSPGGLCRIDGSVPSVKGSTDIFGRAVARPEDWQQGVAVVHYEDTGEHRFWVDIVAIDEGVAFYDGRMFTAAESTVVEAAA